MARVDFRRWVWWKRKIQAGWWHGRQRLERREYRQQRG
jgi:hypothetical protein